MKYRHFNNPYLFFSPFLIIYLFIVIIFHNDAFVGDESRYMILAENLLKLNFSQSEPVNIMTNGIGYPLAITPFLALKLPQISISIMNAFLYYLSIVLIFKTLKLIVNKKLSLLVSIFWAFYYNSYELMPFILSEIFTIFLISLLVYYLSKSFIVKKTNGTKYYYILSGMVFGYIALTKFIFGYVLLLVLIGSLSLWIYDRKSSNYRIGLIITLIAFAINIPYLVVSYNITGKLFQWGGVTGDNLYWMSTPFQEEYGDWYNFNRINNENYVNSHDYIPYRDSVRSLNHSSVDKLIYKQNGTLDDNLLKKIAIDNIKSHPIKYIQNCICNVGRMLFSFPYSYTFQNPKTLIRFPLNGIISVFLLFTFIPTFLNWRKILYPIRYMIFFVLIYLGGSSLASAETRMFSIIVPILLLWIAYILQNTVKFNLKFKENLEN